MTLSLTAAAWSERGTERRQKRGVFFEEGGYVVKLIRDDEEIREAYRLRHRIFCEELKWVLQSAKGLESDEYDDEAVFFGVFDGSGKLLSFLRLILSDRQFMMEKVFQSLVDPSHHIRKEADTAEISRLCVCPEVRNQGSGNFGVHTISLLLFKAVYQWCKYSGIRYLYAVTELKVYRLYCLKGFPYRMIGRPTLMPDGATVVAILMDWDDFELASAMRRPALHAWFTTELLSSPPWQSPRHAPCSTRSVSV